MADCKYYNVETREFESREIRPDRQRRPIVARMTWCAHPKHSPVDRKTATTTAGGGGRLQCEGMISKCPLSAEQFEDVR